MKIHHIGYLVDDIESAAREFEKLGFSKVSELIEDPLRDIYVQFLDNYSCKVELVQPTGSASPVYKLQKKYLNTPYHICYETNNIQDEIIDRVNGSSEAGWLLIQPPQPAPAIHGCPDVVFFYNKYIGIIEFVELEQ